MKAICYFSVLCHSSAHLFSLQPILVCNWCMALMEYRFVQVVESGGKNIEIAVMTHKDGLRELEESEIDEYVAEIEAEKAAAEAAKKGAGKET
jgi:hypothetical protein